MIIKCQKPEECLSLFLKLEVVDIIGIYQGDIRDITWNSMGYNYETMGFWRLCFSLWVQMRPKLYCKQSFMRWGP